MVGCDMLVFTIGVAVAIAAISLKSLIPTLRQRPLIADSASSSRTVVRAEVSLRNNNRDNLQVLYVKACIYESVTTSTVRGSCDWQPHCYLRWCKGALSTGSEISLGLWLPRLCCLLRVEHFSSVLPNETWVKSNQITKADKLQMKRMSGHPFFFFSFKCTVSAEISYSIG